MPKITTVAEYLSAQLDVSEKSQKEIAKEIGYDRPNVVSMMKCGVTKLPIAKVGPLAKALGVDPHRLLDLAMREYQPDNWEAIQEVYGISVTSGERKIIERLRSKTKGAEIAYEAGGKMEQAVDTLAAEALKVIAARSKR